MHITTALFLLLSTAPLLSAQSSACTSGELVSDWQTFRRSHPFHIQTIALGEPAQDGSRVLVIAEPPSHIHERELSELAPEMSPVQVCEQRVGFDGYIKDAVIRLPKMREEALGELLAKLYIELFGTVYKAYITPIDSNSENVHPPKLDLQIKASDLNRWLITGNERFVVPGSVQPLSLSAILNGSVSGVFHSSTANLDAWVIPKGADIAQLTREIRQFALDTDLIVGSVASTKKIAILGRQRVVSVDLLPPLRAESVQLLARAGTDHLAQSYERSYFAAGRFNDRDDWAPVYLSPVLIDTEIGSLLNITDQLLKGWSESGKVNYLNFQYPHPDHWPFGIDGLYKAVGSPRVTYNWNTKGAGYITEFGALQMLALNRTGSLPVSYLPADNTHADQLEPVGYEYFATLNDPNLVRVVQYTFLYQTFRSFGWISGPSSPIRYIDGGASLLPFARRTVNDLLSPELLSLLRKSDSQVFQTAVNKVRQIEMRFGPTGLERLAHELAVPSRDGDLLLSLRSTPAGEAEREVIRASQAVTAVSSALLTRSERTQAKDAFIDASRRASSGWIRTPTIVISSYTASIRLVGGHNWDAETTRLRALPEIQRGDPLVKVDLTGRPIVLANPQDIPVIEQKLRAIANARTTNELRTQLMDALRTAPNPAPKSMDAVLFPGGRGTGGNGGGPPDTAFAGIGPEPGNHPLSWVDERTIKRSTRPPLVFVERQAATYFIFDTFTGERRQSKYLTSTVDDVVGRTLTATSTNMGSVRYQLAGFSDVDVDTFLTNVNVSLKRSGRQSNTRAKTELSAIIPREGATQSRLESQLSKLVNFSTARVGPIRELNVSGLEGKVFEAPIHIPAATGSARTPLGRIRLLYKNAIANGHARIQALVSRVFGRMLRPMSVYDAAEFIKIELKKADPELQSVEVEADEWVLAGNTVDPGIDLLLLSLRHAEEASDASINTRNARRLSS